MKKYISIATTALLVSLLSSCNLLESYDASEQGVTMFKARIQDTKTSVTIEGSQGKISWVKGDIITITDGSSNSAKYVAENSSAETSFSLVPGETAVGKTGPYTATYNGAEPATIQTYSSASVPSISMRAESDNLDLEFVVTSGLLKINLSGEDLGNIKKIMVKGDDTKLYQLDCGNEGIDVSSAKDFWLALPEGSYKKFYFTNASGMTNIQTTKSGKEVTVTENRIRPLTINSLSATGFDCVWLGKYAASGYPVCWADRNIGAFSPEGIGYLFSWGNTEGKWLNGVKGSDPQYSSSNYNNTPGGKLATDGIIEPDSGNDAARVLLGGSWRLPTDLELKAMPNVNYEYISEMKGYLFSYDGNSIFLPCAGMGKNSSFTSGTGFYWGNEARVTSQGNNATALQLKSDDVKQYWGTRSYGFTIRPVKE